MNDQKAQTAAPALKWRIPFHVLLATSVFLAIQAAAVLGLRGTAAPELYLADYTKYIPVNAVEDDAIINITAVLDVFPSEHERFAALINLGGPFILLGRGVMLVAAKLGLVQLFDDPAMYFSYPEQYRRVWVAFGLYKLAFFLPWFPLALYWLGRNHLSPRAGGIAAWLAAALPFVTAFDVRLKTDTPAITAGLFFLLFLFQYLKDRRDRSLALASSFLGLALSMKFLMIPGGVLLLAAIARNQLTQGRSLRSLVRGLALSGTWLLAVFVAANPRVITGAMAYALDLSRSTVFVNFTPKTQTVGIWTALSQHAMHSDIFYGPWLWMPVLAALGFHLVRLAARRDFFAPASLLTMLLALNVAYLVFVAYTLLETTYFFHQPSIIALLLTADAASRLLEFLRERSLPAFSLAACAVAAVTAGTFQQDLHVLEYLRSPSNRQNAHAFLKSVAAPGDSVGVPLAPGSEPFSAAFGVDPFVYRLCKAGRNGEALGNAVPDWLLWNFPESSVPLSVNPGYAPVALFSAGTDLPRWRNNLYQETLYGVYARKEPDKAVAPVHEETLFALGEFVRQDAQRSFAILQYQALAFRPQSLDLLRKAGDTVIPLPTRTFTEAVRDRTSPLAYVHQADRLTLAFWGVKYVLAKQGDAAFRSETLNSGHFCLEPTAILPGGVEVYRNKDYVGQALFLAAPAPNEVRTMAPKPWLAWLRPLRNWGVLYPRAEIQAARADALEVALCVEADGPVDIVLKGGAYRRSLLAGRGEHELIAAYETGGGPEDVGYEIHPAAPGTRFTIKSISVRPLRLGMGARLERVESSPELSVATVDSQAPGSVTFAQPFVEGFWSATIDAAPAKVRRGPANTVAVDVPPGKHLVCARPRS